MRGSLMMLGVAVALSLPPAVQAQAQPAPTLLPDRPGLGDAAHVVAPGVWQLEAGAQLALDRGVNGFTVGLGLIRYGLRSMELRVLPSVLMVNRAATGDEIGASDLAVGLKFPVRVESSAKLAAVVTATLPTGSDAFSARDPGFGGTLVMERPLSAAGVLSLNAGYSFTAADPDRGTLTIIVTPGFPISSVEGLAWYGGYAGFFGGDSDAQIVEAGLAYTTSPDVQLDLNSGWDLGARTWFVGVGISKRWPSSPGDANRRN